MEKEVKIKMPIRAKPYAHQIEGFNLCMENDGYGLLFDVGLGKSLTAVAVAGARYQQKQVNKVLVVSPLAVVPVWEREFQNLTVECYVTALFGSCSRKRDTLQNLGTKGLQVVVINYDSARVLEEELMAFEPDMLIVDESQKIKNYKSKQSKVIHKISARCKYRIILTATPIGNSVADIFSQWKVINPNVFGKSFYGFRAKYLIVGGFQNKQVIGARNMPELLEKMHSVSMRVTKDDALDLPSQVFETRYCELEPKAKRLYKSIASDCYSELLNGEVTIRNILTKLIKLQQCANGYIKTDDKDNTELVSTAKMNLLEETISEVIANGEKAVVFARFKAEMKGIEEKLKSMGIKSLTLDGSVQDKGAVVNKFQEDESIKVIVCQTQVGGVGITLTAASIIIFYSHTFSLIDYLQSIGRTHRIGQKQRCLYIDLIAKDTVDEHIQQAIKEKRNLSDSVVDNWRDLLGGSYG